MDNFTGDKVHFEPASQESTKCGKVHIMTLNKCELEAGHDKPAPESEPMSEPSEELERTELGREYDKFNEGRRTGYAQGRQSVQTKVEKANQRWEKLKPELLKVLEQFKFILNDCGNGDGEQQVSELISELEKLP